MSAAPKLKEHATPEPVWRPRSRPQRRESWRPQTPPSPGNYRAAPNPLRRTLFIVLPLLGLLLGYVFLSTAALQGGYYRQQLEEELTHLSQQNDLEEQQLRDLRAHGRILRQAEELGMRPAPTTMPAGPGSTR